jgi:energy-coupling factor transport system ATP-binding protein
LTKACLLNAGFWKGSEENESLIPNALPLVVRDLNFRYRQRSEIALRDISFQAQAGEIILIAGASGSGKTTLVRCLNGLIPHSYKGGELTGMIRILGQDPAEMSLSETSQQVGTVLQDPEKQIVASYVANEVAFGLENLGVPRPEMRQRVTGVLDHLGIPYLFDRETFHLSGGEKQKVVVAGTLVLEPSIMLLDEPLANLDPFSLREALELIRELADGGKTILIVEHRVEDVLKINPDKVLFLVDGEQRYFGDVAGFKEIADPREVKLTAPLMIKRLREEGIPTRKAPAPHPHLSNGNEGGTPLVEFKDVSFWYEEPEQPVLQDINLSMRPGDVIAILGPNGAGKTTLVKHAIGLLKAKTGQVLVEGTETKSISVAQVAKTLGYVFQSPSHMIFAPKVSEELAFGPRNLEFDDATIERNVAAALDIVDLVDRADDPPLSLSFGQQKRVTIAAVVAMNSRILVMDEPTAGQDYRHYSKFMDAILSPEEDKPWGSAFESIIFITHDLDLAIGYANRVILLSNGRLAADGPPHEVLADRQLLADCRLVPTSLLELNLELFPKTGRFMRADSLATFVHAAEAEDDAAPGVDDHG